MNKTLSAGVTATPQGPEQTHLDSFKESPEVTVEAYIKVSDDNGILLGDMDMEEKAQKYCQMLSGDISDEDARDITTKGKDFCLKYFTKTNLADHTVNGIITKYRLRWGMMLLLQKKALKKMDRSNRWEVWFSENYPVEQKRSAQDYMRLAKIPNIIAFAVLGKDRLMALSRLLEAEFGKDFSGAKNSADPLGEYLRLSKINFDFNKAGTMDDEELARIDFLYLKKRLRDFADNKGFKIEDFNISDEVLLDSVKSLSKPLGSVHFNNMLMIKQAGGNVNTYLKNMLLSSGTTTPPEIHFRTQVNKLSSIVTLFTDILGYLNDNDTASSAIDLETIEALETKIQSLKEKIEEKEQSDEDADDEESEETEDDEPEENQSEAA